MGIKGGGNGSIQPKEEATGRGWKVQVRLVQKGARYIITALQPLSSIDRQFRIQPFIKFTEFRVIFPALNTPHDPGRTSYWIFVQDGKMDRC
jgi:hypothetical protein